MPKVKSDKDLSQMMAEHVAAGEHQYIDPTRPVGLLAAGLLF
jgi:hypothetical protein